MDTWASVVAAALPILVVFGLIATQRVPAAWAALAGVALCLLLATTVWALPPAVALAAVAYGVASGLHPIVYIIWSSLLLYQLTVATGWAERLRSSLAELVGDRSLLLLLIGFGFIAFLDATAGFLTPVTVGTALLAGLGVPPLEAAAYALVASAVPPVFGAMGIPVLVLADVSGQPLAPLARTQAAAMALLVAGFPAWLTLAFGGPAALRRLWIPSLSAGVAYAAALWATVTFLSLYPAALAASLAALAAILLTGRWGRGGAAARDGGLWRAAAPFWPYGVLMAAVAAWSVPAVSRWLGRFTVSLPVPGLPAASWRLDLLASPATAILLATALVALLGRASAAQVGEAVRVSLRQLRHPLASVLAMFALAQVMNASGMTHTLGQAVAGTGKAFAFLGPYLSWLGTAIAGSNTASNALLGRLQAVTAGHLGLDPVVQVALAGVAAPLGKMVAPQVIAAAAAAGGVAGQEGRLLRVGLAQSLVATGLIGAAAWLLAR